MQAVLSNLMAALLLVQVFTGWCDRSFSDGRQAACTGCHQHNSNSNEGCHCAQRNVDQRGNSPCGPCNNRECHGVCTYVPAQQTHYDTAPTASQIGAAAIIPYTVRLRCGSQQFDTCLGNPADSEPPLRLHLLHQILLI